MIVTFDKKLFSSTDDENKKILARLIQLALEDAYQWDVDNLYEIFFEDEDLLISDHPFIKRFLSEYDATTIIEYFKTIVGSAGYITLDQKYYMGKIAIGFSDTEIPPIAALNLFSLPSLLILENSINDWRIIKSICKKYENKKTKKNIYKKMYLDIQYGTLKPYNAGGKNNIINIMKDLIGNDYNDIYKFKLIAIFDSDRIDSSENLPSDTKPIVSYFKNKTVNYLSEAFWEPTDVSLWHMLYKREFENYLPLTIIQGNKDIAKKESESLTEYEPSEYDFIDFESVISSVEVKKVFPPLFEEDFTRDLIEGRCVHHKVDFELPNQTIEQISEIELILLKIAKII